MGFLFFVGITLFPLTLALPLPLIYSSIALCLFITTLFVNMEFKEIKINNKWIIITITFLFLDIVVSTLFLDFDRGLFDETKLAYFVVPFVVLNSKKLIIKNYKLILYSFVVGVLVFVIYSWLYVAYFYNIKFPNWQSFSLIDGYILYILYNYLPGAIHHTYIGLYILAAINILLNFPINIKNKNYSNLLIVFMSFSLFYIGGKITMILLFVNFIIYYIFSQKVNLKYIYAVFLFLTTFFFFVSDWVLYSLESSIGKRLEYYKCGIKVLKRNFVNGVGYKNIKLATQYCETYHLESFIPHNSILYETVANGIIGLIFILFFYYKLSTYFLKAKDFIFRATLVNIILLSLIEDIFHRQRGVFFVTLFISLLIVLSYKDKTIS